MKYISNSRSGIIFQIQKRKKILWYKILKHQKKNNTRQKKLKNSHLTLVSNLNQSQYYT